MSFKAIFIFVILSILSACGVKSDPIPVGGTAIPSFIDQVRGQYKVTPVQIEKNPSSDTKMENTQKNNSEDPNKKKSN